MMTGMTRSTSTDALLTARDALIDQRLDYTEALDTFRWPDVGASFNFAHDWFDPMARGNDAPALVTATVGLAFGHQSEITTEAAGAVIMDTSLKRVDELFHLSRRMRRIALQSAVGGMLLSIVGMGIAFGGWLPPVAGAVFQEAIDLAAVLNALRAATPGGELSDY